MQNPDSPTLDVTRFVKMANKNKDFLEKTLKNTTRAFYTYRKEFTAVADLRTEESMGALIHKMTMSLYYVQADSLLNLMNLYRELLAEEKRNQLKLQELEEATLAEFTRLIKKLESLDAEELIGG